jgi:metal-responsive CopG/Arc/MetJ family transcriptional regulator
MSTKYTNIKIPEEFAKKTIDPIVGDETTGYRSRAEVVMAALREFIKKPEEVPATSP